jgi:hypothetical protein
MYLCNDIDISNVDLQIHQLAYLLTYRYTDPHLSRYIDNNRRIDMPITIDM